MGRAGRVSAFWRRASTLSSWASISRWRAAASSMRFSQSTATALEGSRSTAAASSVRTRASRPCFLASRALVRWASAARGAVFR